MRLKGFLDALYPPFCLLCGRFSDGEFPHCCPPCYLTFRTVSGAVCNVCGYPFHPDDIPHTCLACIRGNPPFTWCRGLYHYDDIMARTVSLVKYGKRITMLGVLVRLMEEALDGLALPEVDGVVPVPLTPLRMAARGFNQAGALALPVARRLGVPLLNRAIGRVRGTPQAGLAGSMRERNARASYRKGKRIEEVAGRRILLFDDVYTTGATVRRCSRILKDSGGWVVVLTLARAVGGKDGGHFVVNDPV